jgi:benzoyl-CoA reductase/2-hydroxyglutaryl-CoA dehydratase subunit BcrC/BadD/HgdB
MMKSGNIGPTGQRLPEPDLLLLSYTGCFTFLKWFELLREEYHCPIAMLHVPYQPEGRITASMRDYVVKQLKQEIIPKLEQISGRAYDEDRLKEHLRLAAQAEESRRSSSQRNIVRRQSTRTAHLLRQSTFSVSAEAASKCAQVGIMSASSAAGAR